MTHVPTVWRGSGILIMALTACLGNAAAANAQSTASSTKKSTPAPAPKTPAVSSPVRPSPSSVYAAAAWNLANSPYGSAAVPAYYQVSGIPTGNSYYSGPTAAVYPSMLSLPSYYQSSLNPLSPFYPYQPGLPYSQQYLQNPSLAYLTNPYNYGPYSYGLNNYGLYAPNPLLTALPNLLAMNQLMQFGPSSGLLQPQFGGLANWNNPLGIGMGLGGLGGN